MKSNHEFDKYLRHEIDSLKYLGAESAWEAFEQGVGQEAIQYSGKKNYISLTRYLSLLLILIGSFGMYAFVNYEDDLLDVQLDAEPKTNVVPAVIKGSNDVELQNSIEQDQDIKESEINGPAVPIIETQKDRTFAESKTNLIENITVSPIENLPINDLRVLDQTAIIASAPNLSLLSRVGFNNQSSNLSLESVNSLPALPLANEIAYQSDVSPLNDKYGQILIPIKKRPVRLFGEFGISNQNTGVKLLAGVSIPMAKTWDIELGAGFNSRNGDKDIISLNFQSHELPELQAEHTYAFSQLINFMAPVRIKKKFKKHHLLFGGQITRNVSNRVELNTATPYRSFSSNGSDIKIADMTVLYQNSRTAVNNYSVISSTEWNFEMTGGYEYQAGRFGIGFQVSKPVAPSFKLFSRDNSALIYESKTPLNFGLNLKYYI